MALRLVTRMVFQPQRFNVARAFAALVLSVAPLFLMSQTPALHLSQPPSQVPVQIPAPAAVSIPAQPDIRPQPKPQKRPGPACVSAEEATRQSQKEVCVNAHVFDVVELANGTRFLDVCPPETSDEKCQFTLLSLQEDREDVGDLRRYRDQDVSVRGIVRITHGRMGIVISHARQFSGGPEKFRPNPKLPHDFNVQSDRMPVRDPNLAPSGRHRSFMNTRDREVLPQPEKH